MDDTNVGSLEDNAAKRKARLAAMKRKLQGGNDDSENKDGDTGGNDDSLPTPIFRSYKPTSDELQDNTTDITEPTLIEGQIQVIFKHYG